MQGALFIDMETGEKLRNIKSIKPKLQYHSLPIGAYENPPTPSVNHTVSVTTKGTNNS